MAGEAGKYSKAELKALERAAQLIKKMENNSSDISGSWGDVSNAILGLNDAEFFTKITATQDDIAKMATQFETLKEVIKDTSASFNEEFKSALKENSREILGLAQDFTKVNEEMGMGLVKALQERDLAGFARDFGEEGLKAFKDIVKGKGFTDLDKFFEEAPDELLEAVNASEQLEKRMQSIGKTVISWRNIFGKMADNMTAAFKPDKIFATITQFDKLIHDAQKETGILFTENEFAMTVLISKTAEFGLNMEATVGLMKSLGDELNTARFNVLADAALDLAAMEKATGLTSDEIGKLTREFVFFGGSTKDVANFSQDVMKQAYAFGVNGRKVMGEIAKNMSKLRTMGFQAGEKSLANMTIQAERLGVSMDEIFDVAKRARTIEGSLEMAAELQLAAGSFANIDPMQLLSAARKGPEELGKILTTMGSDIGHWDEEMQRHVFDPVDADRLQIVADATGLSMESLTNSIGKQAANARKFDLAGSLLNVDELDDDQKAFLADAVKIGEGGELALTAELPGISSLADLSQENIATAMKAQEEERKTLEEQAKQNMGFEDSVTALKDSVMNLFTVFQPVLDAFTSLVQMLNSAPTELKAVFATLGALLAIAFGPAKAFANGLAMGRGFNTATAGGGGFMDSIKGIFGKGKGASFAGGSPDLSKTKPPGKAPGGWISSLAAGIKAFGKVAWKDILKFGAALGIIGVALVGFSAATAAFGGEATIEQWAGMGAGLVLLGTSIWLMSKIVGKVSMKDVLIGSLAMLTLGASMIPFAYAMQMFMAVEWSAFAKAGVAILGGILALTGIGFLMMSPAGVAFLLGAGALALAGVSLAIFGASMVVAAAGFAALSEINWDGFSGMGWALLAVIPGLIGFSLAALAFLNPLTLLGLGIMTVSLIGLASVMSVLAPALSIGAQSMSMMAKGIDELSVAVNKLDTDKLNEVGNASVKMATATALGNVTGKLFGKGEGGGAAKPQKIKLEPIEINLKLNGRDVEKIIIKDTKYIS